MRLPQEAVARVMELLAAGLEPGGVYGPGCVARDIANTSLVGCFVCWCQPGV